MKTDNIYVRVRPPTRGVYASPEKWRVRVIEYMPGGAKTKDRITRQQSRTFTTEHAARAYAKSVKDNGLPPPKAKPLSNREIIKGKKMAADGFSARAIALALGRSSPTVVHGNSEITGAFARSAEDRKMGGNRRSDKMTKRLNPQIDNADDPCAEAIKMIKKMRKGCRSKKHLNCGPKPDLAAGRKILSLTDLHIPFQFDDVLEHALENHGDADTVVLGGDVLEVHSLSKWLKSEFVPFRYEYNLAAELVGKLSNAFKRVVLIRGNHENRALTHFQSMLGADVLPMVESDIFTAMSRGYVFNEKDQFVQRNHWNNVYYGGGPLGWFQQIGRCIFAHPSNSSGAQFATMHTAVGACNWFRNRNYDFDAVVCGHSHKMGSSIWNGKLIIEQGCCCKPLDYEGHPKLTYKSPQTFGYAVVYMDKKGRVDFNKTRNIYRGTGTLQPGERLMP